MSQAYVIEMYQPMLQQLASRIVGSVQDAEDIVHDTFVKWLTLDTTRIANAKAYLVRSVTNNCLNHLESIERRGEELLKAIPEFIQEPNFDMDREVQQALEVIHQKLEPVERAVFLMREIFQLEYEVIQDLVKKKKENCRQLLHRARLKLQTPATKNKGEMSAGFVLSFRNACQNGQLHELWQHLGREIK